MHARHCLFTVVASVLLTSCGDTTGDPTSNPVSNPIDPSPPAPVVSEPYLSYQGPLLFTLGSSESMAAVGVSADTRITITPALPAGLTLDADTGTISGTPTALSPGQPYTLSAVNARGTVTAKVNLEVNDGPFFYTSPAIVPVGTAMTPLTPVGTTWLSGYSVSPALPAGLSLDAATGVISGTPTATSPPAYYTVIGNDVGFSREYGLTLGVADPAAAPTQNSSAPYNCVNSGGFVGTFSPDPADRSYGLIAIAFTPDGNAHARVSDLVTGLTYDSDGLEGLKAAMDGSFLINFSSPANVSLSGSFSGPDLISGTYQEGSVPKHFTASRLGGSSAAAYRYTGGFSGNNGYHIDFGTIDVTGSALSGTGYQMVGTGQDYVLINRQLPFAVTISNGQFTVTVDSETSSFTYAAGQSVLRLGDPYDDLFFIVTYGCQLN